MNLIEELIAEHKQIVEMLKQVKAIGVINDESRKILIVAKKNLLTHLKNEDMKFYPCMHKAAEHNRDLKILLDIFARDMDSTSDDIMSFYDIHFGPDADKYKDFFAMEFGAFSTRLFMRIKYEEIRLYPEYFNIKHT